jgi:hypothetical protein
MGVGMSFYADMAEMVRDLLLPDADGGLGQGAISIKRTTPGTPNPAQPWVAVTPTVSFETVNQIGRRKAEYMSGGTIVTTDLAYMIVPPATITPRPGDTIETGVVTGTGGAYVSGTQVGTIVHVAPYPAHGTPVYVNLWANR